MSKRLEKSAGNPGPIPAELPVVLHSRHQWMRWRGVLIAGITGLAATLVALWLVPDSWHTPQPIPWLAELWGGGLAVTLVAVILAYRSASDSLLATAQKLDGQFAAKGRLEAVAILKDSTSPLAKAQREETILYLARETQARAVRGLPWLTSGLIVLILAHLLTFLLWFMPTWSPMAKQVASQPPATRDVPPASITWQTPETVTEANPQEQVPAEATVKSTTGLQNLTLEISVNGELKKSVPIPAEQVNQPGTHNVKATIPLDELKVQPFDVVSYKLTEPSTSFEKAPELTSPTQFVQVRPFRNPVMPAGSPAASASIPHKSATDLLDPLAQAQLRALSDNMNLAHDASPPTDPLRQKENVRVAADQAVLPAKTEEVAKALGDEHLPADKIDRLRQAESLMEDAGKKILAAQNDAAAISQQKALALITDAEKSILPATEAVASPAPPPNGNPNDPFNDQQKHELSPRQQSLVGQLEVLAKNQASLADDLGKNRDDSSVTPPPDPSASTPVTPPPSAPATPPIDPFGPDANKGNFAERQDRVLKGIAVLQNGDKADLETGSQPLTSAQKQATDSLQQLSAEQENDAREPASTAALDLQQTVKAMNEAGEEETRRTLAETQQKLNDLASQLRGLAQNHPADSSQRLMDTATQVHEVQQGLQSAADHQQNAGSATGATQLNQLAQNLQDQKSASELAAMSKSGLDPGRASAEADNLENLARQAAAALTPAQPSAQDFAGLADALERTEANLAHLAEKAGQSPSTSPASAPSSPPGQPPAENKDSGKPSGEGQPTASPDASSLSQAYHEAFQNLKSQTQQMANVVPKADATAVQDVINRYDKDTSYRAATALDVVRFHADLQKPLEKAIVDIQGLQLHAQREEVVNAPDLDETPAVYRPAVSHYFEQVSRDYHSSPPPDNSKP